MEFNNLAALPLLSLRGFVREKMTNEKCQMTNGKWVFVVYG